MKTIMLNMGREGKKYTRNVKTLADAASVVGGFATCMFYITYFSYRFIADPFIELHLAEAFDRIAFEDENSS